MGLSMTCSGIALFACFAILATLPNADIAIKNKDKSDRVDNNSTPRPNVVPPKQLYEEVEFLAGEDTPVWLTKFHYSESGVGSYAYDRIGKTIYGTPKVKQSLQYWRSYKRKGGFPVRRMTHDQHFSDALRIAEIHKASVYAKRSVNSNEVVYPSVLVVMDYDADIIHVEHLNLKRWTSEQLVTYALAFWGTVDSSFRNIKNPRVSLRIAGIVITQSRHAIPYLNEAQGEKTFVQGLSPMIDYWRSVAKEDNTDFPIGSYDIVVHMTDRCLLSGYKECISLHQQHHPSLSAASKGPPCNLPDQIGGIIIYDDIAFNGLHRAVVQMSKVLGGSEATPSYYKIPRRKWTKKMKDDLSKTLKNTSCMSAPKQFHPPGTPVPKILAGEFMPNQKQCEAADFAPDAWTCWDTSYYSRRSNCESLKCSDQHVWGITCSEIGPPLDGSFCNAENTKICLDGTCVDMK